MLPATEAGVRLSVGLPGHGKTYGIRRELFAASRAYPVIVIDRTREWARPPGNRVPAEIAPVTTYARDVAEAAARADKGARLIIVCTSHMEREAMAALRWARGYPGRAGVVVSEAHNAFPVSRSNSLPEEALDAATAWRHFNMSVWLDTQRPAQLARPFDLARRLRIYSAIDADHAWLRQVGGRSLVSAVAECARRNTPRELGGLGQPGWHVAMYEGVRPAKYVPTRES